MTTHDSTTYRNVYLIGGPSDGQSADVKPDLRHIKVYTSPPHFPPYEDPDAAIEATTGFYEVFKLSSGGAIGVWAGNGTVERVGSSFVVAEELASAPHRAVDMLNYQVREVLSAGGDPRTLKAFTEVTDGGIRYAAEALRPAPYPAV